MFECIARWEEEPGLVAAGQAHPTFLCADATSTDPCDLARRAQRVELRRLVVGEPRGQDVTVEGGGHEGRALKLGEHLDQRIEAAPRLADAVPAREEASQRGGVDGLDLTAQRSQRPASQLSQHVAVAPLPLHPVRTALSSEEPTS